MLRTHRAGKALGVAGVWLKFKEQKGPRCAPHPWSQRVGDITWEPSRLPLGEGALDGREPAWELSRIPRLEWVGQSPSAPLPLFPEGPSHLPRLISPASGARILSGFHFSSPLSPPTSYRFTWGFLPSPWMSGSPTSSWQVP